ncbi:hypothetical protein BC835DRAFT_1289369 [Cytidiella melzeri]|nr:hypothetical protein BC835DRAFT_1289369 [Cytidiella melzeri]
MLQVSEDQAPVIGRQQPQLVRDETYYMRDGSCVLQVENTLFNVHRTLLSKDSSLFSSMFELPQGDKVSEGSSDSCPIHLNGESVVEFKNFLWVLYALPHEVCLVTSPQIDLDRLSRLIDIARVSFKYHFKSIETWALDVITEHVNRKSTSPIFPLPAIPHVLSTSVTATSIASTTMNAHSAVVTTPQAIASNGALVSRLMRLAQLCGHEKLLSTMISVLRQLMSCSIRYAHLAMTLADELDLRSLRGIAYFEVMQKSNAVVARGNLRGEDNHGNDIDKDARSTLLDSEGRLIVSHQQKLRLLTGYYRLSMVWEGLRSTPLPLEHSAACGATWHQHGCTQCWLEFWKEKTKSDSVLQHGLADVLGRLRAVAKEFGRWGSATYMHTDCRAIARKMIQDKVKIVEDSLADYFVDEG